MAGPPAVAPTHPAYSGCKPSARPEPCAHPLLQHPTHQPITGSQPLPTFAARKQDALAVVVGLLAEPLARHPRMREEDIVMVQLVITFLRFVCACV